MYQPLKWPAFAVPASAMDATAPKNSVLVFMLDDPLRDTD
jgi:hypothetical protein